MVALDFVYVIPVMALVLEYGYSPSRRHYWSSRAEIPRGQEGPEKDINFLRHNEAQELYHCYDAA